MKHEKQMPEKCLWHAHSECAESSRGTYKVELVKSISRPRRETRAQTWLLR